MSERQEIEELVDGLVSEQEETVWNDLEPDFRELVLRAVGGTGWSLEDLKQLPVEVWDGIDEDFESLFRYPKGRQEKEAKDIILRALGDYEDQ